MTFENIQCIIMHFRLSSLKCNSLKSGSATYLLQFRSISKGVKLYFFMSKLETRATNNEVDSPREEKSTHLLASMPKKTTKRAAGERTKKKRRTEKPWPQIFMRLVESL